MSASAFAVAFAISRHFNYQTGTAYPGQKLIAQRVGLQTRQVRNVLRQLEAAGHLIIESGGYQKPDIYRMSTPERQASAVIMPATECRSKTGNPVSPERQSGDRVTGTPLPPNSCSKPLKEPVCTPHSRFSDDQEALAFVAAIIERERSEADPREVLLAGKSHHGDRWPDKLEAWTLGAVARAPRKPQPLRARYDGPSDLRDAAANARGEGFAKGYIDPCAWRDEDRTLLARNEFMARRIIEDLGREWLNAREISVGVMAANDARPSPTPKGRQSWV